MENKKYHIYIVFTIFFLFFIFLKYPYVVNEIAIVTNSGIYNYKVDISDTPDKWMTGLRGKNNMADNEGMLFIFPYEAVRAFTTTGMQFTIDLIFLDADFNVIGSLNNVPPGKEVLIFPVPALGVLELKSSDSHPEIRPGDRLLTIGFNYKHYSRTGGHKPR